MSMSGSLPIKILIGGHMKIHFQPHSDCAGLSCPHSFAAIPHVANLTWGTAPQHETYYAGDVLCWSSLRLPRHSAETCGHSAFASPAHLLFCGLPQQLHRRSNQACSKSHTLFALIAAPLPIIRLNIAHSDPCFAAARAPYPLNCGPNVGMLAAAGPLPRLGPWRVADAGISPCCEERLWLRRRPLLVALPGDEMWPPTRVSSSRALYSSSMRRMRSASPVSCGQTGVATSAGNILHC